MAAMAPPPELIPDAVAEILLRVPPDEPAHLLRASLVCKPWRRILTDQAFLRRYRECGTSAYSSETGAWSAATSVANGLCSRVLTKCGTLVGNVICFMLALGSIVMYDLDDHRLSLIDWPDMPDPKRSGIQAMTMEDGSLGLVAIDDASNLFLWSRNVDPNGTATWIQRRVIGIETMLPTGDPDSLADVVGFAEGVGILFVSRC